MNTNIKKVTLSWIVPEVDAEYFSHKVQELVENELRFLLETEVQITDPTENEKNIVEDLISLQDEEIEDEENEENNIGFYDDYYYQEEDEEGDFEEEDEEEDWE